MEIYMDYSPSLPTEYVYPDPNDFYCMDGRSYLEGNQQAAVRGYTVIRVLEFLNGRRWDDIALAYVHALRPSSIRVSAGIITCDCRAWRVTVMIDDNKIIDYIEQEVDVALPERISDVQHLRKEVEK